jgi:Holliday junction resolvase RusA-like endonuclease
MSAMRSTKNMYWLVAKPEEYAISLDNEWIPTIEHGQTVYVRTFTRKDGKISIRKRKSPPNYARQRKYLVALLENKKLIKQHCESRFFELPEDACSITIAFPMFKSWTKKKKRLMAFTKHKSRPDSDNIYKNITDALYYRGKNVNDEDMLEKRESGDNDSRISSFIFNKIWVPDDFKPGPGIYFDIYDPIAYDMIFLRRFV